MNDNAIAGRPLRSDQRHARQATTQRIHCVFVFELPVTATTFDDIFEGASELPPLFDVGGGASAADAVDCVFASCRLSNTGRKRKVIVTT